ncbi:UbiD family decarboxylase [Leptospira sp. GIMC2001]|uniref:UbiD family decarboxylase n=1 Tax=Leptospira sp. GIMC2001 TaxID=1513297 RepID=UPI00234A9C95|nr:UbiD family decarboxylase [Leptospira sp. GIMC2001]WCL47836.1 UbiD family decarboxylase [Leptospira sp. GIMC2001]
MKPLRSTRDFVNLLRSKNEIIDVQIEVDPNLVLAEIQRRNVARKGPALLFHNVKGSKFPMATNLYGSESRIQLAFGMKPLEFVKRVADLAKNAIPPKPSKLWAYRDIAFTLLKLGLKTVSNPPLMQNKIQPANTSILPQLVSWPLDGGPFVTLPLVYTQSPITGKPNLGMYRIQLHSKDTVGMHIQIHRGGGFHYHEAETMNQSLPAHVVVGGPPALTISAIAPLPEEIPETVLASLLAGEKIRTYKNTKLSPLPFLADADLTLAGYIPPKERYPEGPFGDHYGYYALQHDYPILKLNGIYHRNDAIWPATVVGRPPQEDHYLAEYLQDLLSPVFPIVMPQVKSLWAYEESGVHSLAAAIVKERYPREAFMGALRILGEGQLSLTKCLIITNESINLKNFKETFKTILDRFNPRTDLFILTNISQDTLDYTSATVNKGSKMIMLGVGEPHGKQYATELQKSFQNSEFSNPRFYLPGVLLVNTKKYSLGDGIPQKMLDETAIQGCLFVILTDDSNEACRSDHDFIWYVFTRFEPAGDIYSKHEIFRNHVVQNPPIVIDARLKTWFPPVTEPDPKTIEAVDKLWPQIFPRS